MNDIREMARNSREEEEKIVSGEDEMGPRSSLIMRNNNLPQ